MGAQVEGIKLARNGADWHPEGIQLAVPGNENNVLLYSSLSLEEEEEGSLDGAHEDIVNLVAYDRSGMLAKTHKHACRCTQLSLPPLSFSVCVRARACRAPHRTVTNLALTTLGNPVAHCSLSQYIYKPPLSSIAPFPPKPRIHIVTHILDAAMCLPLH